MKPVTFTNPQNLIGYLAHIENKNILLVVPAISTGKSELNEQYRDYLDHAATLYFALNAKGLSINLFLLGADHRGDGFLHEIGKTYLIKKYHIPPEAVIWDAKKFRNLGYCSVEEAELTASFLSSCPTKYEVITSICKSQFPRYQLHQAGYGIQSIYYVFADKPVYYPLVNQKEEDILLKLTEKDCRWESRIGKKIRTFARQLRDPKIPPLTPEKMKIITKEMTAIVGN